MPAIPQATAPGAAKPGAPTAQVFIPPDASLQERRPRTLKHGDTFAVFDHNGDVLSGPGSPEGLYHRDTRFISHFHLAIGGQRPMLLSSTLRDDNTTLTCDLENPDLHDPLGACVVPHGRIHLRRTRFLWQCTCHERLAVRNFDDRAHEIEIELTFAADFADLFELRGHVRPERGVLLSYRGWTTTRAARPCGSTRCRPRWTRAGRCSACPSRRARCRRCSSRSAVT